MGEEIKALINFNNEINIMTSAYIAKLGLNLRPTNVYAKKIDGSALKTYGMTTS